MRTPSYRTLARARITGRILSWLASAIAVLWCQTVHAQWITQTNNLRAGWNAVYLHVDASYTNITEFLQSSPPLEEIWAWVPDLPPGLSVAVPQQPIGNQWVRWSITDVENSTLQTLPVNTALLIRAADSVPPFSWKVKGHPVAPNYRWTLSGLNFVGFPTVSPAPNFENFLRPDAQVIDWKLGTEIFRYQGGNLGPTNPVQVVALLQRTNQVFRDQAYWIRAGEITNQIYNHYFGPFQVTGSDSKGLRFGDSQGQARLYLKNMTRSNLTVTLNNIASEKSLEGTTIPVLPLMVRGALVTSNLSFSYSSLSPGSKSWTLAPNGQPGSEAEIVLGVDRSLMGTTAGEEFASVLRFTDSFGLTRVEIGASATTPSRAGLWVGNAVVDQVSQYLKQYAKATNALHFHQRLNQLGLAIGTNNPTGTNALPFATNVDGHRYEWDKSTGRILVFGGPENGKGSYYQDGPIKLDPDYVARPFPLRLIVHNDGTTSRLLQRAYLGRDITSNFVVATKQTAVENDLANARRLSAVHLPSSDADGGPWDFSGTMQESATLETTINLGFSEQSSNPFLHTYHPDHDNIDNRDDTFKTPLSSGKESYDVRRLMRLTFTPIENDFDSRTRGGVRLNGNYFETITIHATNSVLKQFTVLGSFSLNRITDTATLTQ